MVEEILYPALSLVGIVALVLIWAVEKWMEARYRGRGHEGAWAATWDPLWHPEHRWVAWAPRYKSCGRGTPVDIADYLHGPAQEKVEAVESERRAGNDDVVVVIDLPASHGSTAIEVETITDESTAIELETITTGSSTTEPATNASGPDCSHDGASSPPSACIIHV
jgi:hypothetical protein